MPDAFKAIQWNRQKVKYDLLILFALFSYLILFILVGMKFVQNATIETMIIRATGTAAFILLHVVLLIGPLSRLSKVFLPILYNRRHLGVIIFFTALTHGTFSILQFHAFGDMNPLISVFFIPGTVTGLADIPFQIYGFLALMILFLLAATSHDFWLHYLKPGVWKALHMLIYPAYALIVLHVVYGALTADPDIIYLSLTVGGALVVFSVHLLAAGKEWKKDRITQGMIEEGYLKTVRVHEIPEDCGLVWANDGDRIALFREGSKVFAVSNVCAHQNGPLGEGCLVDGFITCPWHGFQFDPKTGKAPAPYDDSVPVYKVKVVDGRVWIHPEPENAFDERKEGES